MGFSVRQIIMKGLLSHTIFRIKIPSSYESKCKREEEHEEIGGWKFLQSKPYCTIQLPAPKMHFPA